MNIVTLLEMAVDAYPERVAAQCGARRLTYADLLRSSLGAASLIRRSEARHAALLDVNSVAAPILLFGAALADVPYVPMNYRLTDDELNGLASRVTPSMLVGSTENLARLTLANGVSAVERERFIDGLPTENAGPAHLNEERGVAVQLFTSGTTGKPKAAVLRHGNLMAYILGTIDFASAGEDEANLVSVPPYHIAGISAIMSSTYAGRRMVMLESFDPLRWLDTCQRERSTHAFMVPTMISRTLDALMREPGRWDVSSMRAISYGGGRMPVSVIEKAMELLPHVDFTNAYGLTETSATICMLRPDDHRLASSSGDPEIRKRLGSVGRPIGTIEMEIRDESGKALPAGIPGQVFARGGQVAGEYLEIGSTLDAGGWFATRDRGYLDAEGFLFLEGRADDVIVRGGENISPGEIEDVLLAHEAIVDAAVVAIPDEEWGEGIAAAVVVREGSAVSPPELQSWVKERLRSSRVPSVIEFRAELPYNELGKVLRRVIRDELRGRLTE
ncbi:MAG TPA: AMP-binding protein [Alphaproteobacteria bacterium]|nr:AMP-binding protein [Alphaproteobacteria bacterium]